MGHGSARAPVLFGLDFRVGCVIARGICGGSRRSSAHGLGLFKNSTASGGTVRVKE